jgi:hypothetical protein
MQPSRKVHQHITHLVNQAALVINLGIDFVDPVNRLYFDISVSFRWFRVQRYWFGFSFTERLRYFFVNFHTF